MAFVSTVPLTAGGITARVSICNKQFSGNAVVTPIQARARAVVRMEASSIQAKIAEEMKKAEEATAKFGKTSKEAAMAWDVVEELEQNASRNKTGPQDPLDKFCEEAPEADECRTYDS